MLVSVWWWMTSQNVEQILSEKSSFTETMLPDELVNKLKQEEGFHRRETCLSLNLILQFFFQEKRFEAGIMRWITNILTQEFNDLLKHRALSKFIHNMQPHDEPHGSSVTSELSLNLSAQCESPLQPFCFVLPSVLLVWERILAIYRQHDLYKCNRWYRWG
ncbi:hypothetical protein E2C01_042634 [Portunus trituberculatus]|uniref:Uncharacterized protein n=1 Tax=Portunus trituberculatus TaxID=210409 RepID=A0A5B7FVC6_PORTR|nr:hypothetical protein [Portunus trituberculatus]